MIDPLQITIQKNTGKYLMKILRQNMIHLLINYSTAFLLIPMCLWRMLYYNGVILEKDLWKD